LDYYDWDAARKRVKTVLQGEVVSLDGNPTKEQEYYIKHWKVVLSKLLGWSDDKVLEWAKQFEAEVGDVNSLFYHQGPIYYLVPLFVPRRAYDSLSPRDLRKLQEELEFAIMRNPKTIKFEDLSNGERPSEDPFRFVKIIRSAQQKGELLAPVNFDYYDWEAAKERIRTVLRHNGLADDLGI